MDWSVIPRIQCVLRESSGSMPAGFLLHRVLQVIGKACFHWHSQCHTIECTE